MLCITHQYNDTLIVQTIVLHMYTKHNMCISIYAPSNILTTNIVLSFTPNYISTVLIPVTINWVV